MADEGATPRELIIEACRRNNTELLQEVIDDVKPSKGADKEAAVADLLNNARDAMGNAALHVAASSGSYEILDILLDQPGLETDPLDRLNSETPLHKAVQYCNTFPAPPTNPRSINSNSTSNSTAKYPTTTSDTNDVQSFLDLNEGHRIVEILLDAGCDPRIRNSSKMKPEQLVDGRNEALKDFLRRAEFALVEGESGVVVEGDDEDDGGGNSASDSE